MYFITDQNFGDKVTLQPRIPQNYFTRNNIEDSKTPRICCADSIDDALIGLAKNISGQILYVYEPQDSFMIHIPNSDEVPGTDIYKEYWILSECNFKFIKKIKIGEARSKTLSYKYKLDGKLHNASLYEWNWIEIN